MPIIKKTVKNEEKYSKSLSVHYTSYSETADTYIEKFCASFVRQNPESRTRIIVATSDQAQRHTVVGYGAEWMSAQKLAKEVDFTSIRQKKTYVIDQSLKVVFCSIPLIVKLNRHW